MERTLRIGTRRSPLALKQVEEVLDVFRQKEVPLSYEIVTLETPGDLDKETPLSDVEGSDFFTRDIDEALLAGRIDCAVHSAKDLPDKITAGLEIAFMTKSPDPSDALVSKDGRKFFELSIGARIGVSSRRRKDAVSRLRPDLHLLDLRGTIGERLKRLDAGAFDAIIIATVALLRLSLGYRIVEKLDAKKFPVNPLQGRIAVVIRSDDEDIHGILKRAQKALR